MAPLGTPQSLFPWMPIGSEMDKWTAFTRQWVDATGDVIEDTTVFTMSLWLRPMFGNRAVPIAEEMADTLEDWYETFWGPLGRD